MDKQPKDYKLTTDHKKVDSQIRRLTPDILHLNLEQRKDLESKHLEKIEIFKLADKP